MWLVYCVDVVGDYVVCCICLWVYVVDVVYDVCDVGLCGYFVLLDECG